jgi:hypothetical protein
MLKTGSKGTKNFFSFVAMFALTLMASLSASAQVQQGLQDAETTVRDAFTYAGPLVLAIGSVVGLVGGIRVYIKWQNGDQDINKHIVGWVGSCIFLLLVGTILTSFFN